MKLVFLLWLAGCAAIFSPRAQHSRSHTTGLGENFAGQPACQTDLGRGDDSVSAYRGDLQLELPRGEMIHRLMCTQVDFEDSGHFDDAIYASFDDDHFDHVLAAVMTILCVASGECDAGNEGKLSYSRIATLYWYAKHTDLAKVDAEVAKLGLPGDLGAAFVRRARANIEHVVSAVETTHERWKAVYVDTIEDARARRAADRAALATHYARFAALKPRVDAALIDHKGSSALAAEIIAARDAYTGACVAHGRSALYCLTGPIARPLTEQLVRLATALDDPALATAEDATLRLGPDQSDLRYELNVAVDQAMRKENARFHEYNEALASGADRAVVASRFPQPPLDLRDRADEAGMEPPPVAQLRQQEVVRIARAVERVDRRGARAVISFRDIIGKDEHQTDCHETNRVERVTQYGEVQYRVECGGPWVTTVTHDRVAPITVPAVEAEKIKPGETALAVANKATRAGYIVQVLDGTRSVQLRSLRDATK